MIKNQERICSEEDEELEKTTLSLSILNYFKYISKDNELKEFLFAQAQREHSEILKKILHAEQSKTTHISFKKTPVEIETTRLGRDFKELKSVISGDYQCLEPYTYVSFRVLY